MKEEGRRERTRRKKGEEGEEQEEGEVERKERKEKKERKDHCFLEDISNVGSQQSLRILVTTLCCIALLCCNDRCHCVPYFSPNMI